MSNFVYYKERFRAVNMNNGVKTIYENNVGALMCPHCFHIIRPNITTMKIFECDKIEDFHSDDSYFGMCPNCKDDFKFKIVDNNMGEILNILNNKGYYTAFSCEGHMEEDVFSGVEEFNTGYIYFYFFEDYDILESYPLPKTWSIDSNAIKHNVFIIRDNICNEMPKSIYNDNIIHDIKAYNGWIKKHWDKKARIEDLYNWAVNLPELSDVKKISKKNTVLLYGKQIIENNAESYLFRKSDE